MENDLVKRLRILSGMLKMCEPINFGADSAAMDAAADRIETLEKLVSLHAAEIVNLHNLLCEWIDSTGEPSCWFDHNGNCQAHFLEPKGECLVEVTRIAVEGAANG